MIVTAPCDDCKRPLTQEQIERIQAASERSIVYDEESPELSDEQLKMFKPVASKRKFG